MDHICHIYSQKFSNYSENTPYALRFLLFQKLFEHILPIPACNYAAVFHVHDFS